MKYLKKTFSYLKKNFWLSLAVMSIPALAACFLSTPYYEVSFVTQFADNNPYVSPGKTFEIIFGDSWRYLWPVIVISILLILGASLVMSATDKHFRTGKLSLKMPMRLVNNAIFPIAVGVLVMCLVSIVWRVVLYGFVLLVSTVSEALHFAPGAALSIISVFAIVLFFFHILIITPMLFWAPIMFIYGYRFRDAAATSFRLISGKKVFRGLFIPLIVCAAFQMIIGFLGVHYAVACVVNFLLFLATNIYVPVYVFVTFSEISGLDRRDIKPYEITIPMPESKIERREDELDSSKPKQARERRPRNMSGAKKTYKGKRRKPLKEPDGEEGGDVV